MLILSGEEITGLLPPLRIIDEVENALLAELANRVVAPQRLHLDWNGNTLLVMPVAGDVGFGTKIVSVVPAYAGLGVPVVSGTMILNDVTTGLPACVMNAAALTAQRTGAVGSLGVKYLTPTTTDTVGIIGCGVQGAWQAIFACAVRPIEAVFAVSRSEASYQNFVKVVRSVLPKLHIEKCPDVRALLGCTTLVIAATTSAEPVLPDEARLVEHRHFISVGSFKPSMQELPNAVYRLAGFIAVDSEHARSEVGDVINPLKLGLLGDTDVFSITECVTGKRSIDTTTTTVYKTVGAAVFDLYVARALYHEAKSRCLGREIML